MTAASDIGRFGRVVFLTVDDEGCPIAVTDKKENNEQISLMVSSDFGIGTVEKFIDWLAGDDEDNADSPAFDALRMLADTDEVS